MCFIFPNIWLNILYIKFKIKTFFTTTQIIQLYVKAGIARICLLRGEDWTRKTSLTLPLFTEVPVLAQEQSCICVLGVYNFLCFYDFTIKYLNCTGFDGAAFIKKNIIAYIEGWHFSRMWKALTWPHHSLREEDYTHNANFIPLLCIEVSMPNQESKWSCICVVSRFLLSTILIFDSGIVPKVWYFTFSFYCTRLRHNLNEEAYSMN